MPFRIFSSTRDMCYYCIDLFGNSLFVFKVDIYSHLNQKKENQILISWWIVQGLDPGTRAVCMLLVEYIVIIFYSSFFSPTSITPLHYAFKIFNMYVIPGLVCLVTRRNTLCTWT